MPAEGLPRRGTSPLMTTILAILFLSFALSFSLTPFVGRLAKRYGVLDKPSERKVHTEPLPTAGGIALYLAFYAPFLCALFFSNKLVDEIFRDSSLLWFAAGSTVAFALGLTLFIITLGLNVFALHIVRTYREQYD